MSDQNRTSIVSEDIIKLIFNPLRESLTETSSAIKDATQQISKLIETLSNHPNKTDLKEQIERLIKEIEASIQTKLNNIDTDIIRSLEEDCKKLNDHITEHNNTFIENNKILNETLTNLQTSMNTLVSKIDFLMIVIGISFTVAMLAWGVIAFIFNFKD